MKQPVFSIIIPVYNTEQYLPECLDSVVNQTFPDYEAVIVNDGSTDGSREICDTYAEKYPQLHVFHKENEGPMIARKEGIIKANGEYCLFLDSDDFYDKNLLLTVSRYIRKYNLDLLIFGKHTVYQNKICHEKLTQEKFALVEKEKMVSRFMESDKYNSVYTKAIRRKRILPNLDLLYQTVSYAEDALQTADFIISSRRTGILNECLYYYRIRKSSLIHQKSVSRIRERLCVEKKILDFVQSQGYLTEDNRAAYLRKTLHDYMECIYRLNQRAVPMKEHAAELELLRKVPFVRELTEDNIRKGLIVYNRMRAWLLVNRKYRELVILDHFLLRIQTVLLILKKEEGFL